MNENFSENLKKARQDARMTQAEVAKIVGVAKNTYCNWENGTREPNILRLKKLAKILGTNIDTLLGIEPPEQLEKDLTELKELLKLNLEEIYNTFSIPEKRYFWRSIVKEIRYGVDKRIDIIFV